MIVILSALLAFEVWGGEVHSQKKSQLSIEPLIRALIVVESHSNDNAVGDKQMRDKAYGCLQIRKPCVEDVNRRCGTAYTAEATLGNRALSIWICQKYLEMYATEKQLGRKPTFEDLARIWNGGPSGWKSRRTEVYWQKVCRVLEK